MHVIDQAVKVAAVVLVVIAGRAAFLYFWPYRPCRWCRPGGLLGGSLPGRMAGHKPGRKRRRRCFRCHGHKLTRRLGAYHVHKAKVSLKQAWDEREWRR